MQEHTYLFIDGGHLRRNYTATVQRWYGNEGAIELKLVKDSFGANKCFYYDCVDDICGEQEGQLDFEARVAREEAFFDAIQEIPGTHVRLGSMTGTRKNKRQKQVDILLAVDALNHAVRRNMNRVILLTGDQDFKPVVQSLVDMGLFVSVAGDARHTSKDLARSADYYQRLSLANYHEWTTATLRSNYSTPTKTVQSAAPGGYAAIKKGTVGGIPAELYRGGPPDYIILQRNPQGFVQVAFNNLERLTLFCEIDLGEVAWDSA